MSNINTLIAYLNPKKHKGSSSGTLEYHFIKIDEDFLNENQDVLSKNITKSIKKKLEDPLSSPYTTINASSVLYVEVKAGEISYYFQKEINGATKYLTLENLLNNQSSNDFFTELDDSNFVKIEEQDELYYHKSQEAIYIRNTQLAEIQIFSKRALYYNPKELGGLTNGSYPLDFKDAKGYTGGFIERILGDLTDEIDSSDTAKRQVLVELNPKEGKLYWYPDKVISNNNEVTLFYDYHPTENDDFEVDPYKEDFAIKLTFKNVEGFLGFMMVTYFQNGISILDTSQGSNKYNFCKKYIDIIFLLLERSKNNINEALTYLYYIPSEVFETEVLKYRDPKNKEKTTFGVRYLWKTIGVALEGMLTNYGVNSEDIILKLLHGIKITQKDEEYKVKEKNDEVLKQLLIRKTSSKNSYLLTLYGKLNTSSFVAYNTFIYKLWRNSSFTDPANKVFSKTSPLVETKNPNTPRLILPYKTNKLAGFYSSNMNLEFTETGNIVVTPHESVIADVVKTLQPDLIELIEIFTEEDWQSEYHPLQPVFIADVSKDKAIEVQRFSPMLLLKANEDKSFWSNMATAGEYGVDVITTLSGVGNLTKFRHLARIVKAAETLNKSNKFIRTYTIYKTVKGAAAGAEITSGTVNALLKITNVKEKELGKAISEFLFWLELASLSGEVGVALKKGLQKSAKTIVENTDDLNKYLDDLVKKGELEEAEKARLIKEIENTGGIKSKIEDFFERVKNKGKPIKEIFISDIVKQLRNVTPQSTRVAKALSKDKIQKKVLDSNSFEIYAEIFGGKQDFSRISAFEYDGIMYFRENTPIDKFFNEIVHEGTHAIDRINLLMNDYDELFKRTKSIIFEGKSVEKYIKDLNLDELIEFRARFYEREFQIASQQIPDYNTIEEMIKFIKEEY